ncbi:MAG: transcription elongation factor GreA [Fimbriimonadaceae bacterium]|jgi:transcription elongation factor GreA|nr:transcription elongation factor GreA [Fimbriimonadaceae bacterium]
MSNDVLLSQDGFNRLKEELEFLKSTERQRIADNIREAKSHGDLRENAMYHEAKLNQTRLEARIAELERVLQQAQVISRPEGSEGKAHLGSIVKLKDLEWDDEMQVELVGAFEADPTLDKISVTSPMGAALMEKEAGDEIEVEAPAGTQRYRILSVD